MILVWGAGAIGGTVGAYLVRAGHAVTFVDVESAHVHAIADAAHGLAITGPINQFTVCAPASTPERLTGRFERVLLCVKAQHTGAAVRALAPHLAENGYVASLQNGARERSPRWWARHARSAPLSTSALIGWGRARSCMAAAAPLCWANWMGG